MLLPDYDMKFKKIHNIESEILKIPSVMVRHALVYFGSPYRFSRATVWKNFKNNPLFDISTDYRASDYLL